MKKIIQKEINRLKETNKIYSEVEKAGGNVPLEMYRRNWQSRIMAVLNQNG